MDGKTEDVMLEPVTWVKEVNTDDDEDDCEACAI